MVLAEIGRKQPQLCTEDKQLGLIWLAGVNLQEFKRMTQVQDVESMSVPLFCDEVMLHITKPIKKMEKPLVSFSDLSYIMTGLLYIYKEQATRCYDQSRRHSRLLREYTQSNQIFTSWKEPDPVSSSRKRRRQENNQPVNRRSKVRVKLTNIEFDWESLMSNDDSEVDEEKTMQLLKTSKVMSRDQITMREICDFVSDSFAQIDEFEEAENGTIQNFLDIRKLVAQRRSMFPARNGSTLTVTPGDTKQCEDYYEPIPDSNPLSDTEGCRDESEENIYHRDEDVEMDEGISDTEMDADFEMITDADNAATRVASNLDVFPTTVLTKLPRPRLENKRGMRKLRIFDEVTQIPEHILKSRDENADSTHSKKDSIQERRLMYDLKMKLFDKPTRTYMMDTSPMMVGITRVKRTKRKEEDDFNMVDDFVRSFGCQPPEDDFTHNMNDDRPLSCNENPSETDFSEHYQPMDVFDDAAPILEPYHTLDSQSIIDPQPTIERIVYRGSEHEPNLPSINRSQIIEPTPVTVPDPPMTRNCRLASEIVPRTVIQLLNQFVSFTNDATTSMDVSQANFVLKNQQNKKNWGLIGVVTKLFRLWYHETHPVDMQALMRPHKEKIDAALAFYSILELNSPRIGLVLVEKHRISNAVHNIHMSPKLINLLQKNKSAGN